MDIYLQKSTDALLSTFSKMNGKSPPNGWTQNELNLEARDNVCNMEDLDTKWLIFANGSDVNTTDLDAKWSEWLIFATDWESNVTQSRRKPRRFVVIGHLNMKHIVLMDLDSQLTKFRF
eukprot:580338_1